MQLSNKQVGQDISVNFYLRMRDNTYFSKCLLLLLVHFSYLEISLVILPLRTKAVIEDNDIVFSCQTTGQVTIAFDSKIDKNCLGRSGLYSGYSIYF